MMLDLKKNVYLRKNQDNFISYKKINWFDMQYNDSSPDYYFDPYTYYLFFPSWEQSNDISDSQENINYYNHRLIEIYRHISNNIENLRQLKKNWDEQGAPAFESEILMLSEKIINNVYNGIIKKNLMPLLSFLPIPSLLPISDGTIDITWRNSSIFLVIHVSSSDPIIAVGKSPFLKSILKIESESAIESSIINWIFKVFDNSN
ncbi:MAG: hypothetical protein K9W44_00895 [Candidatus Lokiarchaeota archaeon]|nr:hypothetical protein [Candidatus Harpocratesius repetitus]